MEFSTIGSLHRCWVGLLQILSECHSGRSLEDFVRKFILCSFIFCQFATLYAHILCGLLLWLDGAFIFVPYLPMSSGADLQKPHPEQPCGSIPYSAPRSASLTFPFRAWGCELCSEQSRLSPVSLASELCYALFNLDKSRSEEDLRSMDARNKITQDMLQPKVRRSFSDEEGSSEDLLELSDVDSESSDIRLDMCLGIRSTSILRLTVLWGV